MYRRDILITLLAILGPNAIRIHGKIDGHLPWGIQGIYRGAIRNSIQFELWIQGLEQLTSVGGIFEISENFQLTDFCSLSNYASIASNERKDIEVFDNSFNPTLRMIANGECKP